VASVWSSLADVALGGMGDSPATYVPTTVVGDVDTESRARAERTAADGAALFAEGVAEARAELSDGAIGDTLAALAAELGAAVVVVGSRGQSRLEAALLGSVSHALVHHSPAPVLVVPPETR
jgi:nucleotide-binding universal stress UspA family protein